jgi:hypothetical protein
MPFPFSIILFSYVIWQSSIEWVFQLNPAEARCERIQKL